VGRIGEVLSFRRFEDERGHMTEVQVDLGGGDTVTAEVFLGPGNDEQPLPGDWAFLLEGPGTGEWIAVGFADTQLTGTAGPGERIIFSRSAPGVMAAKIHLKADGSIDINDGKAVLGVDGILTVPEDVVGGGKSLKIHTHPGSPLTTTATVGLAGVASIGGNTGTPN
jgi:hypothetical protein